MMHTQTNYTQQAGDAEMCTSDKGISDAIVKMMQRGPLMASWKTGSWVSGP